MTITKLSALTEDYLRPYTGHTLELYTFYLDRFYGWCADEGIDPALAVRSQVERYIQHLLVGRRLSPASVCTALTPVRGLYRFAHQECLIARDPAQYARRPRITSMPRDTSGLDRFQMQAFLLAGQNSGGRYYAAAYLLACMALRAAEACSIRVEDYQKTIRGHRVLEFHGKGGAPARMPIPAPVIRALDAAADGRSSGNLLLRRDGGDLSRQGLGTITNTLGRRAGISQVVVRPHLLRHNCITNALESGASIRKVQDLARHTEPRTTMRYDRNRTSLDDHAIHSLVAYLAPTHEDD
ncbi:MULTISPECIES: tyrosine-type recombinase/integrase [unclassified Knoellia]|uniref:tyrosine-type recombinase/integrase n=1 Tax=Knoellia altitudinis TaxID=3404795 RepID=UPI003606C770